MSDEPRQHAAPGRSRGDAGAPHRRLRLPLRRQHLRLRRRRARRRRGAQGRAAASSSPRSPMFACSEARQQEIVDGHREAGPRRPRRGLVLAQAPHATPSAAWPARAGLNPYEYTQVNVREQCSWVHTDDPAARHRQGHRPRPGRHRADAPHRRRSSRSSSRRRRRRWSSAAGIAGLRAAIGLADIGLQVVPRRARADARRLGRRASATMYPHEQERPRADRHARRRGQAKRPAITVLTGAEVVGKSGQLRQLRRRRPRRHGPARVDPGRRRLDRRRHRLRHLPAGGRRVRLRHRRRR